MSDRSPTPDLTALGRKKSWLDKAEHGTIGRDNESVIKGAEKIARSPAGPKDPMDAPTHGHSTDAQPSLGNGGGNLGDAVRVNSHGGRAPKADYGFLKRG